MSKPIHRRDALRRLVATATLPTVSALLPSRGWGAAALGRRPNILIVICDQLTARVVGAYGDRMGKTPNIDRLASRGLSFSNAYSTCPLCQPSRASLWTGRLPHEVDVLSNEGRYEGRVAQKKIPTLGTVLAEAGYECLHLGKRHDAGALRGFSFPVGRGDVRVAETCSQLVSETSRSPRLVVADFVNPHDICGWVGRHTGPHPVEVDSSELPPLPDNFEIEDLAKRPIPIQYLCCSHKRLTQAAHWEAIHYRHYLAAYYRYTNIVDRLIGRILDALDTSPNHSNTLVALWADHGDGAASHRMVTKYLTFYDETVRVPLIFSGPGVGQTNSLFSDPLISLVDLVPTFCDYAGIESPGGLRGHSLVSWLRGETPQTKRTCAVSEWHSQGDRTISPGRMLRTPRYKYTRYLEGGGEELFDMEKDSGERHTCIDDPEYADVLYQHRQLLANHVSQTRDPFFELKTRVDPSWRDHPLGYPNHQGPSALNEHPIR